MSVSIRVTHATGHIPPESFWIGFVIHHKELVRTATLPKITALEMVSLGVKVSNLNNGGFSFPLSLRNQHRNDADECPPYYLQIDDLDVAFAPYPFVERIDFLFASKSHHRLRALNGDTAVHLVRTDQIVRAELPDYLLDNVGVTRQFARRSDRNLVLEVGSEWNPVESEGWSDVAEYCNQLLKRDSIPVHPIDSSAATRNRASEDQPILRYSSEEVAGKGHPKVRQERSKRQSAMPSGLPIGASASQPPSMELARSSGEPPGQTPLTDRASPRAAELPSNDQFRRPDTPTIVESKRTGRDAIPTEVKAIVGVVGVAGVIWAAFNASSPVPSSSSQTAGPAKTISPALPSPGTHMAVVNPLAAPGAGRLVEVAINHAAAGDFALVDVAIESLDELQKPHRGDSAKAIKLNEEALKLIVANRYAEAVQILREAITADPLDPKIKNNLGYALIHTNDFAAAHQAIVGALAIAPRQDLGWLNLGLLHSNRALETPAIAAYTIAHRFSSSPTKTVTFLKKRASDKAQQPVVQQAARKFVETITGTSLSMPSAVDTSAQQVARNEVVARKNQRRDAAPSVVEPISSEPAPDEVDTPSEGRKEFLQRQRAMLAARQAIAPASPIEPAPSVEARVVGMLQQAQGHLARKEFGRARALLETVLKLDPGNGYANVLQQRAIEGQESAMRAITIK